MGPGFFALSSSVTSQAAAAGSSSLTSKAQSLHTVRGSETGVQSVTFAGQGFVWVSTAICAFKLFRYCFFVLCGGAAAGGGTDRG